MNGKMKDLGYYNGKYGAIAEMSVPMNDRAGYFGDGVYEAALCQNGIIFALDEHIDRLYNSARLIEINIPLEKTEFKELLQEMVDKVEPTIQFLYWQVTRGTAERTHAFQKDMQGNIWITIKPFKMRDFSQPIQLISLEDTRFLHCNVKTLNLLPNVIASQRAKEAGCFEAVFHRGDRVTECSHSNISILKDGWLITAPTDNLILPGISRAHLLKFCHQLTGKVAEVPFTLEDLMNADEVLVTSTSSLCVIVDQIDGHPVGGKATELAKRLQKAMLEEFHQETSLKID